MTTRRLAGQIDFNNTFANAITGSSLSGCRLPAFMEDDRTALAVALKTCPRVEPATALSRKARARVSSSTLTIRRPFVVSARPDSRAPAGTRR